MMTAKMEKPSKLNTVHNVKKGSIEREGPKQNITDTLKKKSSSSSFTKKKAKKKTDKFTKKIDTQEKEDSHDMSDVQDIITEEDKVFLKDVEDSGDEEIALDVADDGKDIPLSEISGFLKQLGIEKYRPAVDKNTVSEKVKEENPTVSKETNGAVSTEENNFIKEKQRKEDTKKLKSAVKFLSTSKTRKNLLFKPEDMWREEKLHPLPPNPPDAKLLEEAEKLAQKLMQDELLIYSRVRENSKRSEARWMKTVLASGTLSDKMAALTLLIQESPVHNFSSLDTLVTMATKKGKREAMMAVDTLRDLFLTGLLPDDRKLRAFNQQPLLDVERLSDGNIDTRDKLLLMWHFEYLIKKKYSEFIKALGDLSFDTLQASKEKAISTTHHLLNGKPEQESVLLSMLVNKLGDPAIKSKATYLLTKLVDQHPNMKLVIVNEVQQLLYRPNIAQRAQYYAICFLVQLRLGKTDGDLALQLIQIYFHFFQNYLKSGEVANKMMSVLLTGVNRAYVYASGNKEELVGQMDQVYKIIPSVNFHTGVQALMLLFQVIDSSTNAADRYYACLYRKLADPALKNSSKQSIFMNLLFKSLKRDIVDRRIKAFLKRILQVYSQQPSQVICGILIILSQILGEKPSLLEVKNIAESVWSDDEEERFVDQPLPEDEESEYGKDLLPDDVEKSDKVGSQTSTTEECIRDGSRINGGKGSWVHRVNYGGQGRNSSYDPYNRNPLYSRAELDCVWELKELSSHYHPTVKLYAQTLLKGQSIKYDGDPFKDFTLIRFLDRFVYKNPKKDVGEPSAMSRFKGPSASGIRTIPVNSKEFLEAGDQDVPVDEKFFLQYFTERAKRRGEDASDVDSDAESVADEEFDALLDNMEKDDDLGDLDLDFAGDKKKTKSAKTKDSDDDADESDEEDDDDDEDLEDDELAAEFEKEMEGLEGMDSDDDDGLNGLAIPGGPKSFKEEDIEFSPDEDDELSMMMHSGSKTKKKRSRSADDSFMEGFGDNPKKKKKNKHDMSSLFASAEEFSHLLEEGTDAGTISLGGSADFRNKDKAAVKQLKWESDRDRWLHNKPGRPGHGGRKPKSGFMKVKGPGGAKGSRPGSSGKSFKGKAGFGQKKGKKGK